MSGLDYIYDRISENWIVLKMPHKQVRRVWQLPFDSLTRRTALLPNCTRISLFPQPIMLTTLTLFVSITSIGLFLQAFRISLIKVADSGQCADGHSSQYWGFQLPTFLRHGCSWRQVCNLRVKEDIDPCCHALQYISNRKQS